MIHGLSSRNSLSALVVAVALAATGCGGGGSDSATVPPPPPAPPPPAAVEPGPVTSVPPAVYADANRKAAFDRINEVRARAGLGLVAQNTALDQAAQAHSGYQAADGDTGHVEVVGRTGFTGERPLDRATAAGYMDGRVTEVVASGDVPLSGTDLVDMLLGVPYHRMGMLHYHPVDTGVGFFQPPNQLQFLTVVFGRGSGEGQGAPATGFVVWPHANATDVPFSMAGERPDPIPENNGEPAGQAASLQVNDLFRDIHVERFEIRDPSGVVVQTKLLVAATDANLANYASGRGFAAALPRQPLKKDTRYTVSFTGSSVSRSNGERTPIVKTWTFTTGARPDY